MAAVRQSLVAAHSCSPSRPATRRRRRWCSSCSATEVDQAIADGLLAGLATRAAGRRRGRRRRATPTWPGSRADGVTRHVTTVDGSETSAGRVAAVLGLVRAWTKPGGAYGASGSDGAVPLG